MAGSAGSAAAAPLQPDPVPLIADYLLSARCGSLTVKDVQAYVSSGLSANATVATPPGGSDHVTALHHLACRCVPPMWVCRLEC